MAVHWQASPMFLVAKITRLLIIVSTPAKLQVTCLPESNLQINAVSYTLYERV